MWYFNFLIKNLEIFSFSPVFLALFYFFTRSVFLVVESKYRVTEQQMEMYGKSALGGGGGIPRTPATKSAWLVVRAGATLAEQRQEVGDGEELSWGVWGRSRRIRRGAGENKRVWETERAGETWREEGWDWEEMWETEKICKQIRRH